MDVLKHPLIKLLAAVLVIDAALFAMLVLTALVLDGWLHLGCSEPWCTAGFVVFHLVLYVGLAAILLCLGIGTVSLVKWIFAR